MFVFIDLPEWCLRIGRRLNWARSSISVPGWCPGWRGKRQRLEQIGRQSNEPFSSTLSHQSIQLLRNVWFRFDRHQKKNQTKHNTTLCLRKMLWKWRFLVHIQLDQLACLSGQCNVRIAAQPNEKLRFKFKCFQCQPVAPFCAQERHDYGIRTRSQTDGHWPTDCAPSLLLLLERLSRSLSSLFHRFRAVETVNKDLFFRVLSLEFVAIRSKRIETRKRRK